MDIVETDLRIKNIVAVLETSKKIDLERIEAEAKKLYEGCEISYNPQDYPGLSLKMSIGRSNIAFVIFARRRKGFGTGACMNIVGATNMEDLNSAGIIGREIATKFAINNGEVV